MANRALLVGINAYPNVPLQGCIHDISEMAQFLVGKCGFQKQDVVMLADERATTAGIMQALRSLVQGAQSGDRLLFHYSGHGAQMAFPGTVEGREAICSRCVPSFLGKLIPVERDTVCSHGGSGADREATILCEVICPVDFDWSPEHTISDRDFHHIFSTVPKGVEFVWVSDSCHSGGLEREMAPRRLASKSMHPPVDIAWQHNHLRGAAKLVPMAKTAALNNVVLIAGCKSDQTSADAYFDGQYSGALTHFLLQELVKEDGLKVSLVELLRRVRQDLLVNHFAQTPQIDGPADIEERAFLSL